MNFVSICNSEGRLLSVSDNVRELLGYFPSDLVGSDFAERMADPQSMRSSVDLLRKAMQRQQSLEHLVAHKSGGRKPFKTYFSALSISEVFRTGALIAVSESLEDIQQVDQLLNVVAASLISESGEDFFRRFIMHITAALHVDYAFITITNEARTHVTMLTFWKGTQFVEGKSYDLVDTPCEAVINEGETCYYPIAVQGKFPKDRDLVDLSAQGYLGVPILDASGQSVGHLAILHRQPLKVPDRFMAVLRIFAFRASPIVEQIRRQRGRQAAD